MKRYIAVILLVFFSNSQVVYARNSEENQLVSVKDIGYNTSGGSYFRFSGEWKNKDYDMYWATDSENIKSILKAAYLHGGKVKISWKYYADYWYITRIETVS
ncbi:hypothetical protein [Vibrio hyugaensis]|uniref:hypothetical protein n=1 Tax=Vibrio hyugaensis TaxID=1534743 RepID=UPI000CE3EF62|nr:hypothetical protein [Vibrio hyugaensis]